ncbi:MAG: DUF4296 domain-containing protein [Ginsengibacter sp.]
MIKKSIYFVLATLLLVSCYTGDEVPRDIIQPTEMKGILWDMMSAQAWASEAARKDSSTNLAAEMKVLSKKVFEIHKVDSLRFNKSYNWYIKHPVVLKPIFDSMYTQKQRGRDLEERSKVHPLKKIF